MKNTKIFSLLMLIAFISMTGYGCKPNVPPYPYKDAATLNAQAQKLSDDFTAYVKDWKAGRVSSLVPRSILPQCAGKEWWKGDWYLKNPGDIAPAQKWGKRLAHLQDWNKLRCLFPDPHCTYMIPTTPYAPFGAKSVIKGQFPHCRYFSIQASPPYDARFYSYLGIGEVLIVDADIIPDAGSVNPFAVGANRNATNRNYTITFQYKKGDILTICGDTHKKPYYRYNANNTRFTSGLTYLGPWGDPNYDSQGYGNKAGPWRTGYLWLRYYAPDNWGKAGFDPLAGVPVPDIYFELATGEQYNCWMDPVIFEAEACKTKKIIVSSSTGDPGSHLGATVGWYKQWGIFHAVFTGMSQSMGWTAAADKQYVRDLTLGVCGMGQNQPAPGNWEPAESCAVNIKYLTRGAAIAAGKVMAIAGKLPTYPKTLNGNATMEGGKEIRYFSLCSYDQNIENDGMLNAGNITSIMDEHIVTDINRNYVLCFSTAADKPTNATSAAGVTWVNWGPNYNQAMTIRWLAVYPDWYQTTKTPDEQNCTWVKTAWSSPSFDGNILSNNNRNGLLGAYQPVVYYITKASFQAIGTPVTDAKLLAKQQAVGWGCGSMIGQGPSTWLILIPLLVLILANGIWILRRRK